jgi:ferredoxin--NADP+ reductase
LERPEALEFAPGQFVNLALEIDGQRVKRSYSLASAPAARPEFYVNRVSGGELTPGLFDLTQGAELQIDTTPQGFFTLDWVPPWGTQLWLVATGTGLGPFVSMWRSGELARFERIVVAHGVREQTHFGYAEELDALSKRDSRFRYVKLVSRQPASSGILSGRITTALASGALEATAETGVDPEHSHFMLCGNPAMIKELSGLLLARGLRKNRRREPGHLTTEKYW